MEAKCDSWHYTGHSAVHSDRKSREFIEKCKSKLPKLDRKIKIGTTGYPEHYHSLSEEKGWTLDEVGRIFIVTKDYFIFQRYTKGDILMITDKYMKGCWGPMTEEKLNKLESELFVICT